MLYWDITRNSVESHHEHPLLRHCVIWLMCHYQTLMYTVAIWRQKCSHVVISSQKFTHVISAIVRPIYLLSVFFLIFSYVSITLWSTNTAKEWWFSSWMKPRMLHTNIESSYFGIVYFEMLTVVSLSGTQ